jgi:hypothetical protein
MYSWKRHTNTYHQRSTDSLNVSAFCATSRAVAHVAERAAQPSRICKKLRIKIVSARNRLSNSA